MRPALFVLLVLLFAITVGAAGSMIGWPLDAAIFAGGFGGMGILVTLGADLW